MPGKQGKKKSCETELAPVEIPGRRSEPSGEKKDEQRTIGEKLVLGEVLQGVLKQRLGLPRLAQVVDALLQLVHGAVEDAVLDVIGDLL